MNINCARILKAVDAYRYLNVLDAGHKGQKNCFCTYYVNNNDRKKFHGNIMVFQKVNKPAYRWNAGR